eukprot:tig00021137_g18986.t1
MSAEGGAPAGGADEATAKILASAPPNPNRDGGAGWDEAWRKKQTGWDAGRPAPALARLLSEASSGALPPLPRGRALVPGCGSGYDALALAREGYQALGVDISATAVSVANELADKEAGADAASTAWRSRVRFVEASFFDLGESPRDKFDLVYDYTFLCALPPELRQKWAEKMASLVAPGGELVTLIFPIGTHTTGPPYAMSLDLVAGLLTPLGFEATLLRRVTESHPMREGKEYIARWRLAAP